MGSSPEVTWSAFPPDNSPTMHLSSLNTGANRLFDFICLWVLPVGFFLLLSSLFFLPDRSLHHKLFYSLFSIPTLLALILRPGELKPILREPIVVLFALFAGYAIVTLMWSPSDSGTSSLVKRPLHTLMLFLGTCLMLRHRIEAVKPLLLGAALLALLASARDLGTFLLTSTEQSNRLIGAGALDNPLLSSHLFGFFSVYWMCMLVSSKSLRTSSLYLAAFTVMFCTVLATGSRTPLVAMTLAAAWIALLCWSRRSIVLLVSGALVGVALLVFMPEMIIGRGDSHRFEIWHLSWNLFLQHPWLGHGYDAPMSLDVGLGVAFSEPHNFALGVLYNVGVLGLLPWLGMLGVGLYSGWKHRTQPLLVLASALLLFGIGAGLTEGGGILSRPKEHWFLLWIPLALIAALNVALKSGRLSPAPLHKVTANDADALAQGAQVIEEDGLGPKVLRLCDGSFLKLFRRRRWLTSESLNPYSERFARNSHQLAIQDIPTPPVLEVLAYPDGSRGVRYQPLAGRTLRQVLASTSSREERRMLCQRLGCFIGQLHQQGVYFRSLHLGNVLVLGNGAFGLIDLADMRILPSPLSSGLRQRNLRHMQRYTEDRQWLFEENIDALLNGYAQSVTDKAAEHLQRHLQNTARKLQ